MGPWHGCSGAQLIAGDSDTIELLDIGGGGKDRKEQRALDIFGVLVAMDPPEGPVPPPCHTPDPSAMPQRGIGCLGSHR